MTAEDMQNLEVLVGRTLLVEGLELLLADFVAAVASRDAALANDLYAAIGVQAQKCLDAVRK